MRIDAHQHFWEYNDRDYIWMGEEHAALKRDFGPADLAPHLEAISFDGSVAVQARQIPGETEYLLGLAARHRKIKAVVGWVDLCSETVSAELARFVAASDRLRGVRHVVHDEPDDDFMLRQDFRRGIASLREFGLTYDLLIFPRHLRRAIRLVDEFPEQPFVVDHIGKPPIAEHTVSPWREELRELARRPNVYCKASGMVTEAGAGGWTPKDFRPYLDIVFDAFGPDRVMIGSDWPVCTLAGEYESVMQIVIDYVKREVESGLDAVLGENCCRFYGIPYDD